MTFRPITAVSFLPVGGATGARDHSCAPLSLTSANPGGRPCSPPTGGADYFAGGGAACPVSSPTGAGAPAEAPTYADLIAERERWQAVYNRHLRLRQSQAAGRAHKRLVAALNAVLAREVGK